MRRATAAIALLPFALACSPGDDPSPDFPPFTGEPAALRAAESMMEAIGGRARWAKLRSLYVEATHTEPDLELPYESRIWRDMNEWKLRIEQESEELHRIGLFSDAGGWILYVDRDSVRPLSPDALAGWKAGEAHNVYVLLHRFARDGRYRVALGAGGRLEFFEDSLFLAAFELDEMQRPARFITRDSRGRENATRFTRWGTAEGLVHPTGGGPEDGSFSYETRIWRPSELPFDEAFDVGYLLDDSRTPAD